MNRGDRRFYDRVAAGIVHGREMPSIPGDHESLALWLSLHAGHPERSIGGPRSPVPRHPGSWNFLPVDEGVSLRIAGICSLHPIWCAFPPVKRKPTHWSFWSRGTGGHMIIWGKFSAPLMSPIIQPGALVFEVGT